MHAYWMAWNRELNKLTQRSHCLNSYYNKTMNGVDDKSRDNCMLYQLCLSFNAYVEALASMQFNNEKKKNNKKVLSMWWTQKTKWSLFMVFDKNHRALVTAIALSHCHSLFSVFYLFFLLIACTHHIFKPNCHANWS